MQQSSPRPQTVYLFDVDGVLADPVEKQVTEPELFTALITFLDNGDYIGLNTGRSTAWLTERFLEPFFSKVESAKFFADVIAVAEKGGTWITFDEHGRMQHGKDQALVLPSELQLQIQQLVEENYTDSMFFDSTKETMISIEMHDGFDLTQYHERQKAFVKDIEKILSQTGQEQKYKIDPSTIATDIEEKHAGKALGVDRFLTLLNEKGFDSSVFVTFGDSPSDLAMADALIQRGKKVTFVYTGDKEKLGEINKPYPIAFAAGYSQGTLGYLKEIVKDAVRS